MNRFYLFIICLIVLLLFRFHTVFLYFIIYLFGMKTFGMELDINNRYISKAERGDFVASPFPQIQLFSVAKLATFIFSERVQLLAATGLLHKPNYIHSIASLIPLLKP